MTKNNNNLGRLSPYFLYSLINNGKDEGSNILAAGIALCSFGCAGYNSHNSGRINKWASTADEWNEAMMNKPEKLMYIDVDDSNSITNIKTLLQDGYVLSFLTNFNTGFVVEEGGDEIVTGASTNNDESHALTIVGYDDNFSKRGYQGAFKLVNSWGINDHPYLWVPYEVFENSFVNTDVVYFLKPYSSYMPMVAAEITMNVSARNEIDLDICIDPEYGGQYVDIANADCISDGYYIKEGTLMEALYSIAMNGTVNGKDKETGHFNFDHQLSPKNATVSVDLTPFIIRYGNKALKEHTISIMLTDCVPDNEYKNTIESVVLKKPATGEIIAGFDYSIERSDWDDLYTATGVVLPVLQPSDKSVTLQFSGNANKTTVTEDTVKLEGYSLVNKKSTVDIRFVFPEPFENILNIHPDGNEWEANKYYRFLIGKAGSAAGNNFVNDSGIKSGDLILDMYVYDE